MKILYISAHETLEADELQTFIDLGHDVFSIGFYTDPKNPSTDIRAVPKGLKQKKSLIDWFKGENPNYVLPGWNRPECGVVKPSKEFLGQFDTIISVHYFRNLRYLAENYGGTLINRTISSIHDSIESNYESIFKIRPFHTVRMSEREMEFSKIPTQAVIRESAHEDKFCGWTGNSDQVITVAKGMYERFDMDWHAYEYLTRGFNRVLCGKNPNIDKPFIKDSLSEADLIREMRRSRLSYVHARLNGVCNYSLAESMVMGIPIFMLNEMWWGKNWMGPKYIRNGFNGYQSANTDELRFFMKKVLEDVDLATEIGYNNRKIGIELFGWKRNKEVWRQFLASLN